MIISYFVPVQKESIVRKQHGILTLSVGFEETTVQTYCELSYERSVCFKTERSQGKNLVLLSLCGVRSQQEVKITAPDP